LYFVDNSGCYYIIDDLFYINYNKRASKWQS